MVQVMDFCTKLWGRAIGWYSYILPVDSWKRSMGPWWHNMGSSFSGLGCGFDRPVTMVRFHNTPQSEIVDNQRNVGKTRVRVPYGPLLIGCALLFSLTILVTVAIYCKVQSQNIWKIWFGFKIGVQLPGIQPISLGHLGIDCLLLQWKEISEKPINGKENYAYAVAA